MTATHFAPGPATAYVSDDVIAVVSRADVDPELMRVCADSTDWEALAAALAAHADAALAMDTGDGVRVGLVGTMTVEVEGAGCRERVTGTAEWTTHRFPRTRAIRIAPAGTADVVPGYCVDAGVVPASVVVRTLAVGGAPGDAFDDIFGRTADRSVEAAAVRDEDPAAGRRRPPFGVLVFSTGLRVIADRTIVIGRNPRRDEAVPEPGAIRRRRLAVTSPGVSRRHAVVHVDGWHASIDDLGSSNGTRITLPGGAPRAIRPGHPVDLVPGATVDLGGEVSFAVEEVA